MVQSFVLAALAFQDNPPVWAIYVVAAFGGMATAFDNPARRSFVVEMVPEDHITNAVSLNSALMTGSRIIGPALGGLLVVTVGFGWAFLLDGLSYIAVLVGLWMIDSEQGPAGPGHAAGQGPGARRPPLRLEHPRALGAARDDGGHRHAGLQLPDRAAAVRHPRPRRRRRPRSRC